MNRSTDRGASAMGVDDTHADYEYYSDYKAADDKAADGDHPDRKHADSEPADDEYNPDYPTDRYSVEPTDAEDGADSESSGRASSGRILSGRASAGRVSAGKLLNWPTVLASTGVAAVISALIVAIGAVGVLVTDDRGGLENAAAQPTVVNLGSDQIPQAQAEPSVPGAAMPSGQVPVGGPVAPAAPAASAAELPAQRPAVSVTGGPAVTGAPASVPAALSPGQLTTKVKLIMNPNASRAARVAELQGGEQALTSADTVARMLASFPSSGFTYQIIGPVTVSGTTMTAQLQMSLVGNGSRYKPMKWVWLDNGWKLSNESVCVIAAYASIPCSV